MKRNQYIILFVILLALSGICILLDNYIKSDGLLINLATEFFGIILTIYFVDRIFKYYENENWKGVDLKIKRYIQTLFNKTITSIRLAFGLSLEDLCDPKILMRSFGQADMRLMENELVRISKEILEPTALTNLNKMDTKGYKILNDELMGAYESAERIIVIFGSKLSAKQFELLLDIQDCIRGINIQQTTWPDYFGVLVESLPEGGRIPAEEFQQQLYEHLGVEIKNLLSMVRQLYTVIEANEG
ncbi:MAG: hypothetical protein VB064_11940 [Oscillospiraceae bacterium]|nr:hypothetical protein [Oscillospiraceae bacterium]